MLETRELSLSFSGKPVIRCFSHVFPQRGMVVLMGPSGSGKTTLLRLLSGLQKPDEGTVLRDHQPACCFQEYRLFPQLTAEENVYLLCHRKPEAPQKRQASEMLAALALSPEACRSLPAALSGGMRQRVNLARALCAPAPTLLLDEPLKELDAALREKAAGLILERAHSSLILITVHDEQEALRWHCPILTPEDWCAQ